MAERDERQLEQMARRLYRTAVDELPPASRARLEKIRGDVLAPRRPRATGLRWAAAVAGLAAIALAVSLMSPDGTDDLGRIAEAAGDAEDMELLLTKESLDMLSELDFYLWLDAEPDAG